jgi:hypothetical protein
MYSTPIPEPDYSECSAQRFVDKYQQVFDLVSSTDYLGWSQAFAQFRRESNSALGRRRGNFLGSETHMCEGDGVWVLAGANTPVVLRELDNSHH